MSETSAYMTEERLAFRAQARDFTEREVLPVANRLDPEKGDMNWPPKNGRHEVCKFDFLEGL